MKEANGGSEAANTDIGVIEKQLAEIWRDILDLKQVDVHEDFFLLGADSLSAVELICKIKQSFGKTLALESLADAPTIESLAKVIEDFSSDRVQSSLVGLQIQGSRPPFFCVHGVGGEVIGFTNLARYLAPDQPFYGIRSTTPECPEDDLPTLEAMAARYVDAVRSLQPNGPYYLGGYSFGGSVAYEMARQLDAQGEVIGLLAILDHTPAPIRYQIDLHRPSFYWQFLKNLPCWILDDVLRSDRGELLSRIRVKLRCLARRMAEKVLNSKRAKSVSRDVEGLFDLSRFPMSFRELLEEHYRLLRNYVPTPYRGCVTLFRARTRPLFRLHGYDLGWKRLAQCGVKVITVPGNHAKMLREPQVNLLAERLSDSLRAAQTTVDKWVYRHPAFCGQQTGDAIRHTA